MINVESIKFNDRYVSLNTTLPTYDEIVWGTSSSEDLSTTSGDDLIDSAGGNDKILDNGGDDTLVIFGYTGNFEVMTVAGITKIYGDTNVSGIGSAYYGDIIKTINVESIAFANQTIALNTTLPSGTSYIYWSYTSASETITTSDEIDLIDGSGGSDYINGKGGNDTLAIFSDKANFEIITIAGLTKIYGTTYVSGLASDYWLDTIRLNNVENIAFADQTVAVETSALSGSDNYIFWGSTSGTNIDGTSGNDVIDSGGGSDYIYGDAGDDTLLLFGNKAEFEIVTLSGLTKIYGLDIEGLSGAYWADTIRMYSVESIMFADQTVTVETAGLAGTDSYSFWGSTSGTNIDGTSGNDVIDSGGGSDTIDGGTGDDTLLLFGNKADFEMVTLGGLTKIYGLDIEGLSGAYWADTIRMQNVESIMFADQTITVDTSYLSNDSYWYWGSTSSNTYDAGDGNDVIDSGGGSDTIDGGTGDDTLLLFGNKADFEMVTLGGLTKIYGLDIEGLSGAYWADTIRMQNVESIMFADQTITVDTSYLSNDSYWYWGSTSSNTYDAGDGNDVIDSGGGSDTIDGGTGDDTLLLFGNKADFEMVTLGGLTKIYGLDIEGLSGAYWADTIRMQNVESIMFADQTITVDTSYLSNDSYWYWGSTSSNTYDAGDGNDVIDSGGGSDTIDGGTGDDTLLLFGNKADFEMVTLGGLTKIYGLDIEGLSGAYWADTIRMQNVESIMFADQAYTKTMATILMDMEHYPGTDDKQALQTIIDSATSTANEKIIATAIINIEHYATDEDKNKLQNIIDDATSTAAENTLATIIIAFSHQTTASDDVQLLLINDNLAVTVDTSYLSNDSYWYWGSTSSNTYDAGDGNDVIDSGGGSDTIDGGTGDDTLLLFGNKADFEMVTLGGLTKIYGLDIEGLSGAYWADTIRMQNVESIMFADQTITVDTSYLSNDSYWYWGSTSSNTYDAGDGNDVIDSGGGSDTIDGGTGDDTLLLFANKSTFDITVSGDTITLTGNSGAGLAGAYYLDTITMNNVETIMFADQTVEVADLSSSSSGTEADLCPICGISHNNDQSEHPPVKDIPTDNNTTGPTLPINPDGDDNPYPIILPGEISLWSEEYDLGLMELPWVADQTEVLTPNPLESLEGTVESRGLSDD